jgi:hypothetical protein
VAESRICSIEGCGKKLFCKGLCRTHYNQTIPPKPCAIVGCESPAKNNMKLCWKHYSRASNHGDPEHETKSEEVQKFLTRAAKCTDDDCLFWPFPRITNPKQPRVSVNVGGKTQFASRYVCQLAHGEPPTPNHEAAHSCGNGHLSCVNGSHLRWATTEENMADKLIHGTDNRGERNHRAKLTEADVRRIRELIAAGVQVAAIAGLFSVTQGCIKAIHIKRTWFWLT